MAVSQEVERLSINWMIRDWIPWSSSAYFDASLGKLLNPKLLPMVVPMVFKCEVKRIEKLYISTEHLPFAKCYSNRKNGAFVGPIFS